MSYKTIDNKYQVLKVLTGGMGIVYLCLDKEQDDFPVALKTIKPEFLANPDARNKFLREANIWIQLGLHPNIVHAYKVEYFPEKHETYIVTEFIQTPQGLTDASLRSWIITGRNNLERVLNFSIQIIHGMKYATAQIPDLVHRDLKPENILIGPDEIAKVTDFGIASSLYGSVPVEGKLSLGYINDKTHNVIGTLWYMSPEQLKAQSLDCRSDIYAFGLILYEMLSGKPAIIGQNDQQIILSHLNGDALRKSSANIDDKNLTELIMKCVQPEARERYKDWGDLENSFNAVYKTILGKSPPEDEYPIDVSLYGIYQKGYSYLALGVSYLDTGDYGKAESFAQKALELAQKIDTPRLEAAAVSTLGMISSQIGVYETAINNFEYSIKINIKLFDYASQAMNLGNMGGVYQKHGEIGKARDYFQKSLELARSEGLLGVQAAQLGNMGISFAEQGDFQKAIDYYNQAIVILINRNNEVSLSTNYSNLANIYLLIGDLSSSEKNNLKALELAIKNGVMPQQCIILNNLANVAIAKGELPQALKILTDAVSISNEIGDNSGLCTSLASLAKISGMRHDYKEAIENYEQALSIANELNNLYWIAAIQLGIGNLQIECGNLSDAIPAFEKCINTSHQINDRHTEASAFGNLGKVYAALFDYAKAIPCLEKSIEIAQEIGADDIQGRAAWTIGVYYELIGKNDEAIRFMQYAVQVFRKYNNPEYEQAALHLRDVRNGEGFIE
ncbi:MAG: hypothetical protein A2Y53_07545 [Chloroflexi bacterium RBG_16_47_49]|nr:MAG: hypothetical protein A2Y53_07545 [Chloroflexi bacterium RBG_16_47_49]